MFDWGSLLYLTRGKDLDPALMDNWVKEYEKESMMNRVLAFARTGGDQLSGEIVMPFESTGKPQINTVFKKPKKTSFRVKSEKEVNKIDKPLVRDIHF